MKYIWLGIKDYFKDCWHDWHLRCVEKMYKEQPMFYMSEDEDVWVAVVDWKEGSLWHYIQQYKVAKKVVDARNK